MVLQEIPSAGDDFVVVKKPKDAKALVAHRAEEAKQKAMQGFANKSVSLEELLRRQVEGEPVKLNLIIKSDVGGTSRGDERIDCADRRAGNRS